MDLMESKIREGSSPLGTEDPMMSTKVKKFVLEEESLSETEDEYEVNQGEVEAALFQEGQSSSLNTDPLDMLMEGDTPTSDLPSQKKKSKKRRKNIFIEKKIVVKS